LSANFKNTDKESQFIALVQKTAPEIFDQSQVQFSYLYGSYATGEAHPFSDLDIGIFVEKISAAEQLEIELSLALKFDEKLSHAVSTDVRIINTLPLAVQGEIITNGILIYSCNEIERVDFEKSVRKDFFDFSHVLRQYQKKYIRSMAQ
jgi:predicted nucleotidyltransferase